MAEQSLIMLTFTVRFLRQIEIEIVQVKLKVKGSQTSRWSKSKIRTFLIIIMI
jgi:hypothetical protein